MPNWYKSEAIRRKGLCRPPIQASLRDNLESVSRSGDIQLECVHCEGERHAQRM